MKSEILNFLKIKIKKKNLLKKNYNIKYYKVFFKIKKLHLIKDYFHFFYY